MGKKKRTGLDIGLQIGMIALLIISFIVINRRIDNQRRYSIDLVEDDWDYAYQIDDLHKDSDSIVIEGWFFELQKYRNEFRNINLDSQLGVVLCELDSISGSPININGRTSYCEKAERVQRTDVNEYFLCECDYSKCGFIAKFSTESLSLNDKIYQVVIKPDINQKKGIRLNAYICNGKLQYTNPVTKRQLNVAGTDLEKIVKEGICLVSREDIHCDVYQYGWKLYWIVDDKFRFSDGGTRLEFELNTTQFDRLPAYRTEREWYFANIGGKFEDYEITNRINCGDYRVSVRDLPNGYSISSFEVGEYEEGGWIWRERAIRPYYDFSSIPDPQNFGYLGDDVAEWLNKED